MKISKSRLIFYCSLCVSICLVHMVLSRDWDLNNFLRWTIYFPFQLDDESRSPRGRPRHLPSILRSQRIKNLQFFFLFFQKFQKFLTYLSSLDMISGNCNHWKAMTFRLKLIAFLDWRNKFLSIRWKSMNEISKKISSMSNIFLKIFRSLFLTTK